MTSMSTSLLSVFIDSAKNLPCLRGSKQPDVYLELSVGNKKERTGTILRSCDPVWEQGFTLLVGNPETNSLNIRIMDEKTNSQIGCLTYAISTLITKPELEEIQQPFDLQNAAPDSKVVMSLALRILKYDGPVPSENNDDDDLDIKQINKNIERQESIINGSQSSSGEFTTLIFFSRFPFG